MDFSVLVGQVLVDNLRKNIVFLYEFNPKSTY